MSQANSNKPLDELLERLAIDELADGDWQELTDRMAGDDDAVRGYVESVAWRQSLSYLVGDAAGEQRPMPPWAEDVASRDPASDPYWPDMSPASGRPVRPATRPFSAKAWTDLLRPLALAVSLAFVAGAGIMLLATQWRNDREAVESTQASRDMTHGAPLPREPLVQESQLGQITGLSLDASADGLLRTLKVGQDLRCGEVIQLNIGFMRVVLHSGPELIIEGPAEFSIVGKDIVFVRAGRIAARCAGKLMLQSPLLAAECNDAEVSFSAADDTATEVYAYKGVVTLRSIAHRRTSGRKLAVLHGNHGVAVRPDFETAGVGPESTAHPEGIVRSWADVEARLSDFERLVLSDRPVAYWPLVRVRRNRRVLDLTQHGYDGQAIGNWPIELSDADQIEKRGAFFNGESYIEPDRKPPIDMRKGFTIEGWAKVHGGPNYQAIFTSRWVLDAHTPHLQCLGFTLYAGKDDCWELWTGSGKYGQLWKEMHSNVPIVRHQWTHVVATFDPHELSAAEMPAETITGVARIYVDGKFAAEETHEMSLLDFEWPARIGAAEFVPNSLTAWLFRGSLRDIAVYDYPLEASRIEAHYKSGKKAG